MGLGKCTGLGDMLNMLGIDYGSEEAIDISKTIGYREISSYQNI